MTVYFWAQSSDPCQSSMKLCLPNYTLSAIQVIFQLIYYNTYPFNLLVQKLKGQYRWYLSYFSKPPNLEVYYEGVGEKGEGFKLKITPTKQTNKIPS